MPKSFTITFKDTLHTFVKRGTKQILRQALREAKRNMKDNYLKEFRKRAKSGYVSPGVFTGQSIEFLSHPTKGIKINDKIKNNTYISYQYDIDFKSTDIPAIYLTGKGHWVGKSKINDWYKSKLKRLEYARQKDKRLKRGKNTAPGSIWINHFDWTKPVMNRFYEAVEEKYFDKLYAHLEEVLTRQLNNKKFYMR